jgi:hypothetical protein
MMCVQSAGGLGSKPERNEALVLRWTTAPRPALFLRARKEPASRVTAKKISSAVETGIAFSSFWHAAINLLEAAKSGHTGLGELEAVGRKALRKANRRSA